MGKFESLGLRSGSWQGLLRHEGPVGRIVLMLDAKVVAYGEVEPTAKGLWHVSVPIDSALLVDGMSVFLLWMDDAEDKAPLRSNAEQIGAMPIVAGEPMDQTLQAELALLRAELELLKREFRRITVMLPTVA